MDAQWRYISVRRLLVFLERSIDEETRWVVSEPNNERLSARVVESGTACFSDVQSRP